MIPTPRPLTALLMLLLLLLVFAITASSQSPKKERKKLTGTVTEIIERKKNKVHCMAITEGGKTISIKRTGKKSAEIVSGTDLILVSRYKVRFEDWAVCEIRLITTKK